MRPPRKAYPWLPACLLALSACGSPTAFESRFEAAADRPWIGADYWANPLQDWRLKDGRIENFRPGGDRNVFLLTREVGPGAGELEMSVRMGRLEGDETPLEEGWAGFRVGIRGSFNDYRDSAVRGVGLHCGVTADGRLFIGTPDSVAPVISDAIGSGATLSLRAEPSDVGGALLTLSLEKEGTTESVSEEVDSGWLTGGLALVSSSGPVPESPPNDRQIRETGWALKSGTRAGGTLRIWFDEWRVSGSRVTAYPNRALGPVIFAMHTLSKGVLKLNAILAPVDAEGAEADLEVYDGAWKRIARVPPDPEARTATFRIPEWDGTKDTRYRVAYMGGTWEGTVRRDPVDKDEIVVAAFTGNNDLGFPHADIVRNIRHHAPDLMAFTGDNVYERVGEYGIVREPTDIAILDYLRKWYIFGWEYGELLREIPTVALPDDHDVYQGNIWGAGGRKAHGYGKPGQDQGGYVMDPRFVHVVQTTQTANMPDPYDPTPIDQGIAVYYTDLLYGGVSFAIIEDRKWKDSATALIGPGIINGWAQDPKYDARKSSDSPDFPLLGERQETFLEAWAQDWDGAWMKAAISQTIFANVCTLPAGATTDAITGQLRVNAPGEYPDGEEPVQDHDSNGWPQSGRNRALRLLRKASAVHIAGDQHLGSTVQYGIEDWNDASWAICVPSVANIFPRRWFPTEAGRNRKPGAPGNTGEYLDGFGNKVTIHAVSNPATNGIEPTALNHRAPGYGIIRFRRHDRSIEFANWPRWVDASEPGATPYAGWPIRVAQADSGLPKGFSLPAVDAQGKVDPVVQVVNEADGEIVYTYRIQGSDFTPSVRKPGRYTVRVFDPETGEPSETTGLSAVAD
ncbi:MAG: alkaline phosphatase D family protein [Bryobacterales bacterium]|nr:alkaline phosphatase D family protein [Bryobacterales bacterium]